VELKQKKKEKKEKTKWLTIGCWWGAKMEASLEKGIPVIGRNKGKRMRREKAPSSRRYKKTKKTDNGDNGPNLRIRKTGNPPARRLGKRQRGARRKISGHNTRGKHDGQTSSRRNVGGAFN